MNDSNDRRCKYTISPNWRCGAVAMHGKDYCAKHGGKEKSPCKKCGRPTINRDAVCTSCRLKKRRNASERVAQSIADWLSQNASAVNPGVARIGCCDLRECTLNCTIDLVALAEMVMKRVK